MDDLEELYKLVCSPLESRITETTETCDHPTSSGPYSPRIPSESSVASPPGSGGQSTEYQSRESRLGAVRVSDSERRSSRQRAVFSERALSSAAPVSPLAPASAECAPAQPPMQLPIEWRDRAECAHYLDYLCGSRVQTLRTTVSASICLSVYFILSLLPSISSLAFLLTYVGSSISSRFISSHRKRKGLKMP